MNNHVCKIHSSTHEIDMKMSEKCIIKLTQVVVAEL